MKDQTFKSKYLPMFAKVCSFLGDGWRIDTLDQDYDHRIKLTAPNYKKYSICARLEKGRIIITGSVDYQYYPYAISSRCTVNICRNPRAVADDIRKKILPGALDMISEAMNHHRNERQEADHRQIVLSMLRHQVTLTNHYHALTGFNNGKGVMGVIKEVAHQYQISIDNLSTDQLIKLMGFVSTLK